MKLYVTPFAPNALRVQTLMLEKGIVADVVDVSDALKGEYLKINALGEVPALALDGGEVITESLTICHYLDEVSATPRLFGDTAEERARIGMWERRAELGLFIPSVEYGHHTHAMFEGRVAQHPDWAGTLIPKALKTLDVMAEQLDRTAWLAGEKLSAADFTAALGYFGLLAFGAIGPSPHRSIQRWAQAMLERPSMAPLRQAAEFLQAASAPVVVLATRELADGD
jgi:glutathione S-transferase